MHDGSVIHLKKLDGATIRVTVSRRCACSKRRKTKQEFITGLIYINEERPSLRELERLPETPLARLPESSSARHARRWRRSWTA